MNDDLKSLARYLNNNGFRSQAQQILSLQKKENEVWDDSDPRSNLAYQIDDEYASYEDFIEHYTPLEEDVIEHQLNTIYYGRNVAWVGTEGKMLKVTKEYAYPIEGNIFYSDKLAKVRNGILESPDRVYFYAPYGMATKIDLQAVKESIEHQDDINHRPWTTGDDELDEYLVDPESALSIYDPEENPEEYEEAKRDFEKRLKDAVNNNEGDLGEWAVQIRDGNHRAFGAFLAGEPYIWVAIADNQLQELDYHPGLEEILE